MIFTKERDHVKEAAPPRETLTGAYRLRETWFRRLVVVEIEVKRGDQYFWRDVTFRELLDSPMLSSLMMMRFRRHEERPTVVKDAA